MKEMIQTILAVLRPFYGQILKYGGIIAGLLLLISKSRQDGQSALLRKQGMENLKGVQTRNKIEMSVDGASDAEYKRLYDKWRL